MQAEPEFPVTIDEAEAQGWQWIGVECVTCRYHVLLPFKAATAANARARADGDQAQALLPAVRLPARSGRADANGHVSRYGIPTHDDWPFPANHDF